MTESITEKLNKRNSSIELLRIIMMLQVIFLHVCTYGGYYKQALALGGGHTLFFWIIWLLSRCPVYMFIIIMGYFMSESDVSTQRKRILKVYIPMWTYAVGISLAVFLTKSVEMGKRDYVRAFFPALSRTWYFMTLYLILLVLSPYLNKLIHAMTKKEFLGLLGILFFIFSIWNLAAHMKPFDAVIGSEKVFETEEGKSLYDFIFMYFLGAFLRRYEFRKKGALPSWRNWMNLIVFLLLGFLDTALLYVFPEFRSVIGYNDNPLVVLQCIFLFRFFSNIEFHSRFINVLGGCNLGIYMLHEHPLLRKLIWNQRIHMNTPEFYGSSIYILKILAIILGIYSVCCIIEWLRQQIMRFCFR